MSKTHTTKHHHKNRRGATELVVVVKAMSGWRLMSLLVLWLTDPSAYSSLDLAVLGFYWSSQPPCACWIRREGNVRSVQENVSSLGQVDP